MPPVLTSASVVGRERSAELFDAAYAEHARRAAAALATGSTQQLIDGVGSEGVLDRQHGGPDDAGPLTRRRGDDAEVGGGPSAERAGDRGGIEP